MKSTSTVALVMILFGLAVGTSHAVESLPLYGEPLGVNQFIGIGILLCLFGILVELERYNDYA